MTLITSWITPKFKIIASDSRTSGAFFVCNDFQKVFSNKEFAVGLFGGFDTNILLFRKVKMISNVISDENWDIDRFKSEISSFLKNNQNSIANNELVAKILVIPRIDEPFILKISPDKKIEEINLIDYKKVHQKELPPDIFFSEQKIPITCEVDFIYQHNLLKQFEKSKDEAEFDMDSPSPDAVEKLVKHFYSAVYHEQILYKKHIGGDKIFLAYSLNGGLWIQKDITPIAYPEYCDKQPKSISDINFPSNL